MRALTKIAFGFALWVTSASAQGFEDDFESGTLLTSQVPAGRWDGVFATSATRQLGVVPSAAHRGGFGLRQTDREAAGGAATQGFVSKALVPAGSASYTRFWFRMTPLSASGNLVPFTLKGREVRSGYPGPTWEVTAREGAADLFRSYPTSVPTPVNQWALVETELTGIGSAAGTVRVWINGALLLTSPMLDWRDPRYAADNVSIGQIWADDPSFTGDLDFDDLRTGGAPWASTLVLSLAAGLDLGAGCVPTILTLVDTPARNAAPAPYAFSADVTATAGTFHSNPSCSSPTGSLALATGATQGALWFAPAGPGTTTLSASFIDFLPGSLNLDIPTAPDEPATEKRPNHYRVGCSCAETEGAQWLLGLSMLELGSRFRRRRPRTRS